MLHKCYKMSSLVSALIVLGLAVVQTSPFELNANLSDATRSNSEAYFLAIVFSSCGVAETQSEPFSIGQGLALRLGSATRNPNEKQNVIRHNVHTVTVTWQRSR